MRNLTPLTSSACLLLLGAFAAAPAGAGASLETVDITAGLPSPVEREVIGEVIPIRWDPRCIPVRYSMNTTLDPVPNPLPPFAPFLTLASAQGTLDASMDRWNDIPTAYIDLQRTGTTGNPGVRGFDMVNELTFRTPAAFGAIASSPSVSFIVDVVLAHGDHIDGDADSDVSSAITTCQDADGDGDIELPAGSYPAGTIIENDVQFNTKVSNGLRFTNVDAQIDTVTRSVDLMAVAVHELGHSFGLGHTPNNQTSPSDGTESTMFPGIDTGDPAAEIALRSPEPEEVAFVSFRYPEGTAASGPAALQSGDVAFTDVYSLLSGEITHGVLEEPLAGANVFARDRKTGKLVSSAISGTTRLSVSAGGGLFFLESSSDGVLDGNYTMPAPKGHYLVGIEPLDGVPVLAAQVNFTTQIGSFYGHQTFLEESYQAGGEGALEHKFGHDSPVSVDPPHHQSGVDLVTNQATTLANFGAFTSAGFINSPAGRYYAIQIPASQVEAAFAAGTTSIQGVEFITAVADSSVVPIYAEATLTTGAVTPAGTATVELASPLARTTSFVGQDADFTAFYFDDPVALGDEVQQGIDDGSIENLFLVLRIPTTLPFPGISGQAPLIGVSNSPPIFGLSYLSSDGGVTFIRNTAFNFMARLVLSAKP